MALGKKVKKNRPVKTNKETVYNKWVPEIILLWKEGYSNDYIREVIEDSKDGEVNKNLIDTIFSLAHATITDEHFTKEEEVIALHVKRYNDEINRLRVSKELGEGDDLIIGEDFTYEQWLKSRTRKIGNFYNMMAIMYQKEKILGYHNKNFKLIINNEETVEVHEKKQKIDVSKLTFEEQVELYYLMKKSRKDENELMGVIGSSEVEVKTIDVKAEIVEDEKSVADKIEHEPYPVSVPVGRPTSTIDPTVKLRETIKKMSLKRFKQAGGKLTKEEEKILEQDKLINYADT